VCMRVCGGVSRLFYRFLLQETAYVCMSVCGEVSRRGAPHIQLCIYIYLHTVISLLHGSFAKETYNCKV